MFVCRLHILSRGLPAQQGVISNSSLSSEALQMLCFGGVPHAIRMLHYC